MKEYARRANFVITGHVEWHEEDFEGDLKSLRGMHQELQDFCTDLPYHYSTVADLVGASKVTVTWEDIEYERDDQ